MQLHDCGVARVVNGIIGSGVEVVGDDVVLIAVVVEKCLVVGLQALYEQGSSSYTVSSSKHL